MPVRAHLVLGAGGFLGRHLSRAIAHRGERVDGIDIMVPDALRVPGVTLSTGDLFAMSEVELRTLLAPYDVVHHLAWSTIPATAAAAPEADLHQNVALMIRLLSALRGTDKTMVFGSSGGTVYGNSGLWLINESAPLQPIGAYGAGKVAAETYANVFRLTYDVDIRIARISNPYGAGQSQVRPQGAVSHFVYSALSGKDIEIWGDGSVVRDYIHVSDVAEGLMRLAIADRETMVGFPVINLASGVGTSLNEIILLLEEMLGAPLVVRRSHERAFDVKRSVLDIDSCQKCLGWTPRFDLKAGVSQMIRDFRANPSTLFSMVENMAADHYAH